MTSQMLIQVSSIASSNDESKNRRLLFYGHAISNLMNNPLLVVE